MEAELKRNDHDVNIRLFVLQYWFMDWIWNGKAGKV
jgi:hypothetical protein